MALPPMALRPSPLDDPQFSTPFPAPRLGEVLQIPQMDLANAPRPNLPNGSPFPPRPVGLANFTPGNIPNVSPFTPPIAPLPPQFPIPVSGRNILFS